MKRSGFKPKTPPTKERTHPTPIPEHLRRKASFTGSTTPRPKPPEPIRSEAYRRLVAQLPCCNCGKEGRSQTAHQNENKAKGRKVCDFNSMPLCADEPGMIGCHTAFDQYKLFATKDEHTEAGRRWALQTREKLSGFFENNQKNTATD